jgi:SAM-dependent methyltransferase
VVTDPRTDRATLQGEAYADSGNLRARASLYSYDEGGFELVPWVLGTVTWPAPGLVLDVGCGPGRYLAAVDGGIGLDLSLGMVREAVRVPGVAGVQGDVGALPVASGSVGRVLAPHMLYHAADPEQAVAELRRVLAPGGDAVVVLNDARHLAELRAEIGRAAGIGRVWETVTTEDAVPMLQRHFATVEVHPHQGRLLITDPEAVAHYVASMASLRRVEGRSWDDVVDHSRAWAADEIAAHGHAEVHSRFSTLVGRT